MNTKLKRYLAICMALVSILALLSACGSGSTDPASTATGGTSPAGTSPGGAAPGATAPVPVPSDAVPEAPVEGANLAEHIDIIFDNPLTVVNPLWPTSSGTAASFAVTLIFDRMLDPVTSEDLRPQLATDWKTDDYQTFTFYLRDDVYFHNGDHFTADDVVWTHEIAMAHPGSQPYARWYFAESVTAVDTYVVEIKLHEPYIEFPLEMAHAHAAILNKRAYDENPDDPSWGHVGTGPFKVVDFSTNSFLSLERHDKFWGDPPPTKSLMMWTIPEMSARTVMLQNGEAQISLSLTPEDLDMFYEHPDFQVFGEMMNYANILGFNNQGNAVMMDPNFRRAVAHALNHADLAMAASGRWATPVWDSNIWGIGTQFRKEGFPLREYDPALARSYLEESVYNGEELEIMAAYPSDIRAAELAQLLLADVGINVKVEVLDPAGMTEMHRYDPDSKRQMHLMAYGANTIAVDALRTHHWPGLATNRLNYNNEYVIELIEKLATTTDENARRAIAYEVQDIFYEEIPAVPLFIRMQGIAAVNGVGGLRLGANAFDWNFREIFWNLDDTPANLLP
ncbi:MAG: ABC transporter substrate-binding protein [Clostridiales bacterium]|nr:ABC transporter substrate-binding protein [Clostridiales bacterium]